MTDILNLPILLFAIFACQMRVAIIDMGTNTFHLLIADAGEKPRIIYRGREPVKIGKGGINNGHIVPEGIQRGVAAVQGFKKIMDDFQVKKILAFGTSAIRNATNGRELTSKIEEATGIQTKIITGDEEAQLIYYGVRAAMDLGKSNSLIVDIGGGSVEFIIANSEKIFWKESFEIGAQRLLERFQKHDPILRSEIAELDNYFSAELKPLLLKLKEFNPTSLVGSSGTFDTLSDIHCIRKQIHKEDDDSEIPLTFKAIEEIYNELILKNREERMQIPGMIEMRVDMIVVACCLIQFITDHHHFDRVRVSTYSLKEGVLASLNSSI